MPVYVSTYFLPPPKWKPKGDRYPSGWKMTKEDAEKLGLTDADIVPGSTEERKDMGMQSAGRDGARASRGNL